jgi:dTDP-4-amino-4,6-dideoxygalactose transaminase
LLIAVSFAAVEEIYADTCASFPMEKKEISFNKPHLCGNELKYIQEVVKRKKLSGNGHFTNKVHSFFTDRYQFRKCLLTTSCTDALEMAALLLDIQPGDEVIMPSYTFVSTANAFLLRGATIIFADSRPDHPGIDEKSIEQLISPRTKAIVPVHYAGVACDMDMIMDVARRHSLFVVEDAAQAIDSFYKGRPLGSFGHLSAFSFHETKNVISGEGGMLVINDDRFLARAEILWEKGTNRSAFWRGEVDKYGWVDVGSSFLPSEITAAFLYAQLENLDLIQQRRLAIWNRYNEGLKGKGRYRTPHIPDFTTNNGHMYYLVCESADDRTRLIGELKKNNIHPVFHYLSLHKSTFYGPRYKGPELIQSDLYTDRLVRLPFYYDLDAADIDDIINQVTCCLPR